MTQFVEVAALIPGRLNPLDYHLPAVLEGKVQAGSLVVVPLGGQRVQGVVLRCLNQSSVPETRPVESLVDDSPVLTGAQIELARWLSHETLSPLGVCLDLMLPPGLAQTADVLVRLNPARSAEQERLSPLQKRLVQLLSERGELRGRQIEAAFRRVNWKPALQGLIRRGWVVSQPYLAPTGVRPRIERMARLAIEVEEIAQAEELLGRAGSPARERRKKALQFLANERQPVAVHWVTAASGASLEDLKKLETLGLIAFQSVQTWRDPLAELNIEALPPPLLTNDQQRVLQTILSDLSSPNNTNRKPILLHGITGSGKTEIYLQAVQHILEQGKQAIVLVPEIALTPQTIQRFQGRFPGRVGVIHSRLSAGERYDTWQRARAGLLRVIVGPRSALFAPLPNIGLLVVDEFHDPSYYQSEPTPVYHAVRAAIRYAEILGAGVILGSATPEIGLMYQARRAGWRVLEMPQRIMAHRQAVQPFMTDGHSSLLPVEGDGETAFLPLPPVEVVDMRQELKAGNRSMFSRALQRALGEVLERNQQAILYLNRLGSATYVFCRDCGASVRCPRCDRPLTYHESSHLLICHTCNYRRHMPRTCPQCGSSHIRQFGAGTEKVEQEVHQHFPQAKVLRWDSQTTRRKGAHEAILEAFAEGKANILVGTQILAKGLDLPRVTLVGVVLADAGLNLDDFRAAERTFQLLTQVAGRAGRSPLGGRVILQTFQPEHYAIQAASRHDYAGFYQYEIEQRRKMGYPPFARLVRMEYRHSNAKAAETAAQEMAQRVADWIMLSSYPETEMIGPVPCFFAKEGGQYRWQIILRGMDPASLLRGKDWGDWRVEVDPYSLL
ncbi:MAG: primosomal protein N' [Bellilinea sp.]|nr:MAG: primosomal protein N' [Bellilinea sp.]